MEHTLTLPYGWNRIELRHLFDRINRKNYEKNTNVLTISAKHGLISQKQFFNKNIASEDLSNYCLIQKGDFAYNKSYSVGYGYGAIKRLQRYDTGIVSPLYICFTPNERCICPEFYLYYFESSLLDNEIKKIAQEGARNHGLLNINVNDFFAMPIPLPPLPEQKRIAEILIEQDKLIALKERLITAKKKQKKWLMQNLLTGKIRLEGFNDKWEKRCLDDMGVFYSGLSGKVADDFKKGYSKYITFTSVLMNRVNELENLEAINIELCENQNAVRKGDIFFNTSSENPEEVGMCAVLLKDVTDTYLNSFCFGYRSDARKISGEFLTYLFNGGIGRKIMYRLAQGVTRYNLSKKSLGQIKFLLPPLPEQVAIAERLIAADQEIELLSKELEAQKQVKKYLMQKLLTGKIRVTGGES